MTARKARGPSRTFTPSTQSRAPRRTRIFTHADDARRDFADHRFQSVQVHRLNQVLEEAGFPAAGQVLFHAEAAEGDAFEVAAAVEELAHQVQAAAVGEAQV